MKLGRSADRRSQSRLTYRDWKDIQVSLSGDVLTFKGKKRAEKEEKEKDFYMSERAYGLFHRCYRDKMAADLSEGMLKITLPNTAEAQHSKQIEKIRLPDPIVATGRAVLGDGSAMTHTTAVRAVAIEARMEVKTEETSQLRRARHHHAEQLA
jgi:hypothetical protein